MPRAALSFTNKSFISLIVEVYMIWNCFRNMQCCILNSREDRFDARPTADLCKFAKMTKWTLKKSTGPSQFTFLLKGLFKSEWKQHKHEMSLSLLQPWGFTLFMGNANTVFVFVDLVSWQLCHCFACHVRKVSSVVWGLKASRFTQPDSQALQRDQSVDFGMIYWRESVEKTNAKWYK